MSYRDADLTLWEVMQQRKAMAEELRTELTRSCPDSQVDEQGARINGAARAGLRAAIEIIEHNPLKDFTYRFQRDHWGGLMEAAMRLISDIEMAMYDPRSHPERYEL